MRRKRKATEQADDLWIAPKSTLKGPRGERGWDFRPGGVPSNSRFLELADIALGMKKKGPARKRYTTEGHKPAKRAVFDLICVEIKSSLWQELQFQLLG